MIDREILQTRIQELSEIQSKLVSCGSESLRLASELVALTLTLSTRPEEDYQTLRKSLDSQLMAATCAMKSISQQVKTVQQSVASQASTLSGTMNGSQAEWLQTLSDSWIMSYNTLLTAHQKNSQKLSSQLTENAQSAWVLWDSTDTSNPKE